MSQFSGKCDFYDSFCNIQCDGLEDKLKKTKIYVAGRDGRYHLVKADTIKDIAKYYPYLVGLSYGSENVRIYHLASRPYIDKEEEEHIKWRIDDALRYWRRCYRQKKKFDKEEYLNSVYWMNDELTAEIAERVLKHGKNASFDDLHTTMGEYYRRQWFEELVRLGYTELEAYSWCFNAIFDSPEIIKKRLGRNIKDEVQPTTT